MALRSIAVVSGKGGAGKTVTAINLAHAMSKRYKRTLLIDGNLATPNIHIYVGWPVLKNSLVSVLKNESNYKDAIYTHKSGLKILPSVSSLGEVRMLKHERLEEVVHDLEGDAEIILLDSAAGVGREALGAMQACDEVLIVTNPELSAVLDAQKSIQLAHELGKVILGVILNKKGAHRNELSTREVESLLDVPVIGVVPFDAAFHKAVRGKHPATHSFPNSRASKTYEEVAGMLLGRRYFEKIANKKGLKHYVLRKLGFA